MAKSKRKSNAEYQKAYRERKRCLDEESFYSRECARWRCRKDDAKIKSASQLSLREHNHQKRKWKNSSKKYRKRRKMDNSVVTPPLTPDQTVPADANDNSNEVIVEPATKNSITGKKKIRRDRAKAYHHHQKD